MQGRRRPLPPAKPLTPKQERFCEEYVVDLNIAAAGKRAGFSPSAHIYELMQDDRILKKIEELQKKASIRAAVTVDDVVREYKKIAFSNITDYLSVEQKEVVLGIDKETGKPITQTLNCVVLKETKDIDPNALGAIVEVKQDNRGNTSYKLYDKVNALTKLGEHLGMFKEDVTVHGNVALTGISDMADTDKKQLLEKVLHRQNNEVIEAEAEVDDYDNE